MVWVNVPYESVQGAVRDHLRLTEQNLRQENIKLRREIDRLKRQIAFMESEVASLRQREIDRIDADEGDLDLFS